MADHELMMLTQKLMMAATMTMTMTIVKMMMMMMMMTIMAIWRF